MHVFPLIQKASVPSSPFTSPIIFSNQNLVMAKTWYLGVLLDSHLTYREHTSKLTKKLNQKLYLYKKIRPYLSSTVSKNYLHAIVYCNHFLLFTNMVSHHQGSYWTHRTALQLSFKDPQQSSKTDTPLHCTHSITRSVLSKCYLQSCYHILFSTPTQHLTNPHLPLINT